MMLRSSNCANPDWNWLRAKRAPTPATIGEIATFFWGRRAAQMRIADSGLAHVVVGMDWEQLDPRQLVRLL